MQTIPLAVRSCIRTQGPAPRRTPLRRRTITFFTAVVLGTLGIPHAHAQCGEQWFPDGGGIGVTNGREWTMAWWDSDGPGPQTGKLVVAGNFSAAGSIVAKNIATFDIETSQWGALGAGLTGDVEKLAALPDGTLVAASRVNTLSTLSRWDGASWTPIATTVDGITTRNGFGALCPLPSGDLVVGGTFTSLAGVAAANIARWDGTNWHAMGAGLNARVNTIALTPTGDPMAGGEFTGTGGPGAFGYVARWNGTAWTSDGLPGTFTPVHSLAVLQSGAVVVGARQTGSDPFSDVAVVRRRVGSTWTTIGYGSQNGWTNMILPLGGEEFIVVGALGYFVTSGGQRAYDYARWNGSSWSNMGDGVSTEPIFSIVALPNGGFASAGFYGPRRWDGSEWVELAPADTDGLVYTVAALPTGGYVAGGSFTRIGGVSAANIATFDGTTWRALGSGVDRVVRSILVRPDGSIVVVGTFTSAGGQPASRVAQWDGVAWAPLGSGVSDPVIPGNVRVNALTRDSNGDIVVAGWFSMAGGAPANNVARWNGSTWSPVSTGLGSTVNALCTRPSGEIVAGGSMLQNGSGAYVNHIAGYGGGPAWWGYFLGVNNPVMALTNLPDGSLLAAGGFSEAGTVLTPNRMAAWNPTIQEWSPFGTPFPVVPDQGIGALTVLENGDVLASGQRYHNSAWTPLGPGAPHYATVLAQAQLANGDVVLAGYFNTVNNAPVARVARWGLPPSCHCDSIDFNGDGLFPDTQDIADFLTVFAGGVCSGQLPTDPPCNSDIDFNNDGLFPDTDDIGALIRVFGGGTCA